MTRSFKDCGGKLPVRIEEEEEEVLECNRMGCLAIARTSGDPTHPFPKKRLGNDNMCGRRDKNLVIINSFVFGGQRYTCCLYANL
jgi:hypothetical protein